MGAERRIVRGFVVAETGIPVQLKGEFLGTVMQNAGIKFSDLKDERLNQRLKFRIGLFVFRFVSVIPLPIIVCA